MATILTIAEVAKRYKVEPSTIRDWARTGAIPAFKRGKLWRFNEEELEEHDRCRSTKENGQTGASGKYGGFDSLSGGARSTSRVAQLARRLRRNLNVA